MVGGAFALGLDKQGDILKITLFRFPERNQLLKPFRAGSYTNLYALTIGRGIL